ncbi:unnamed protein product [Ilex paraguariensis]|uniref:Uncharacterized protein n=1 Tax=Ilex paraguariensis TaxID=185542 RepID=A0ABC8U5Z2_9AQUA
MEESDELKRKTRAASMATVENSKSDIAATNNSSKAREEGELSSSDEGSTLKHYTENSCQEMPSSEHIKAAHGPNLLMSSDFHEIRSSGKALKPTSDDTYQSCSFHVPDNNLETSNASLKNASIGNCLGKINMSGNHSMDIQAILDIEEMQDKELEEAQEHRRKCEVEERNAFKAYRKAQRALIEADAKCSYLYRRRELYSTHFRTCMMEDSSLFWSLRPQNHVGGGLNSLNSRSEVNTHSVPTSSHQMQAEFDAYDQCQNDLNIQSVTGALQSLSDRYVEGQNMAPDPCSEPDASTSDPLKDNSVADVFCSPSDDVDILADEDEETVSFDHKSGQFNIDHQKEEEIYEERIKDTNDRPKRSFSIDSCQDSLLLEAALRSQLVSKLGKKSLLEKRGPNGSMEPAVEGGPENDDVRGKTEKNLGDISFSEAEKDRCSDLEGSTVF